MSFPPPPTWLTSWKALLRAPQGSRPAREAQEVARIQTQTISPFLVFPDAHQGSSVQTLSASPGHGLRPRPPWQWVLNGRLPACDLTFPICKCKIKSPAHVSAQPQAQSKSSEIAALSLSRTNNANSISGILSLAYNDNRTSYLMGTRMVSSQGWKYVELELGTEEVSKLLPSSTR